MVARLLVKEPDGRFANAAAVVNALERCRERIKSGVETADAERAVEFDPEFALAYADLVYLRSYSYAMGWDRSDANLERIRYELQTAKRLQPDLPQVAEGEANYLFRVENNYEEALRVARLAEKKSPNHPAILVTIGNILRRTGRLEEAVGYLRRAEALSPPGGSRSRYGRERVR